MVTTDFELEVQGALDTYANGDVLELFVEVTNVTDNSKSDTLELYTEGMDGEPEDSLDITLSSKETEEYRLKWVVENVDDAQRRSIDVVTSNDTAPFDNRVTLRPFDDTVRVRFSEPDKDGEKLANEQNYVEDATQVGPNT